MKINLIKTNILKCKIQLAKVFKREEKKILHDHIKKMILVKLVIVQFMANNKYVKIELRVVGE